MDNMRALVDRLNETSYAYYVLDNPIITDAEWDKLYDRLRELESETGIILLDSPSHRVGGEPLSQFDQHQHIIRMLSMDKAQTEDTLREWALRMERFADSEGFLKPEYVVEHKFDGLTICLTYEHGVLIQAATRGNGITGEAILAQAKTIRSIPLTIPYQGKIEIRGETYMRLSVLEDYNKTAAEPLKNARNAAAGALRNLDPNVTAQRKLDAVFYDVGYIDGKTFADSDEMYAFLSENHFPISRFQWKADNIDSVIEHIRLIGENRNALDYLIDGAVVKVNNFAFREAIGSTEKFPRWAIAFKYESQEAISVLRNVTWEMGRTGKLTPLAHLDPIEIAGATVRKATLNNWGDILRKKVSLGAQVFVRRSNEVIPEITGRVDVFSPDEKPVLKPEICPYCGSKLVEIGAHLFCPNRDGCLPQAVMRLSHYAGREAMGIDTFSEKTAELLAVNLDVREPWQLYAITPESLMELEGFKEKRVQNLIGAIEKSKNCALDAFIFAIGIPNIGRKTARDLAAYAGSLNKLRELTPKELTKVQDVGDIVAASVCDFFADEANTLNIDKLLTLGVKPEWKAAANTGGVFSGMKVVVTGTLVNYTRQEAEQAVINAGGTCASSVSKNTTFVLAGEKAGSKLTKAQSLGIEVISEEEFQKRLGF